MKTNLPKDESEEWQRCTYDGSTYALSQALTAIKSYSKPSVGGESKPPHASTLDHTAQHR